MRATINGELLSVGMADGDQRREFLQEIQLMKTVGSHKNIVNMLGCCTLQEPMFLLVEYIPYGDLLHYLRKRRRKVKYQMSIEYLKFTLPAPCWKLCFHPRFSARSDLRLCGFESVNGVKISAFFR